MVVGSERLAPPHSLNVASEKSTMLIFRYEQLPVIILTSRISKALFSVAQVSFPSKKLFPFDCDAGSTGIHNQISSEDAKFLRISKINFQEFSDIEDWVGCSH